MTAKESIKKINNKTFFTFILIFLISIIIFISISFYEFYQNKFEPEYYENYTILDKDQISDLYHTNFRSSFLFNFTIVNFFKNLFFITLLFFSLCFSFVISRSDLITSDGRSIIFAQIVSTGLYILIFLTGVYFVSIEFLVPYSENKLEWIRNATTRSIISLQEGNISYYNQHYEKSLEYYIDYINNIEDDGMIEGRIREIENKISTNIFDERKKKRIEEINEEDTSIADTLTDYIKLADIYFHKKDYYTAWYFYKYVAETDSAKRKEALEKIDMIKKLFSYENSLKTEDKRMLDAELVSMFTKKEREIQTIYELKNKADIHLRDKEYHKAFFTYKKILNMNPNLRDVVHSKNRVYVNLTNISVELSDIQSANIYPLKDNFVFMLGPRKLIYIGAIIRVPQKYFLYNVKIYNFNNNYKVESIIEAPYGETKSHNTFTLYAYSLFKENIEYYPMIKYPDGTRKRYKDILFELPININTLYNFSYDYHKTINFSLFKLFRLKNSTVVKSDDNADFSIGINNDFIKTAIADKLSKIFIFFSISLIFISLAWRMRSNYLLHPPIMHLILMMALPVFFYIFVNIIQTFITSFYSFLSLTTTFFLMIVICIALNLCIMLFSIVYIAGTKDS